MTSECIYDSKPFIPKSKSREYIVFYVFKTIPPLTIVQNCEIYLQFVFLRVTALVSVQQIQRIHQSSCTYVMLLVIYVYMDCIFVKTSTMY